MKNISKYQRHYSGVGRRKTSTARVYLCKNGSGAITVNNLSFGKYFAGNPSFFTMVSHPLRLVDKQNDYDIKVNVRGGGFSGQAEAIRLGIARSLLEVSLDYRTILKSFSLLTRDSRVKERKKYGLKAARKASQFSKR